MGSNLSGLQASRLLGAVSSEPTPFPSRSRNLNTLPTPDIYYSTVRNTPKCYPICVLRARFTLNSTLNPKPVRGNASKRPDDSLIHTIKKQATGAWPYDFAHPSCQRDGFF